MTKIALSVVVITKNAASQLGPCLESVRFADEVVVVDSGSEDGTVALAQAAGARVITHTWLGFGRQKQFAVNAAKHDWVLCLDADERVTPSLEASIFAAFQGIDQKSPAQFAWRMPRRNSFLGRWLKHGEGYPDYSLRLFNRHHAAWSNDEVHETVITTSSIGTLKGDLLHDSAETIDAYLAKQNRYSSLHARALFDQGVRVGYSKMLLSPMARFVKFYFLRLGFLDGGAGFAHIVIGCFAAFSKYAKLIELSRKR
jgi:glycosyltransferase involved in cell wall biosynthesis